MNIKLAPVLALILLFSFLGCTCAEEAELPKVTMENKGQNLNFPVGQRFQVVLSSNPTTGYEWSVKDISSALIVVENTYKGINTVPDVVGASGMEIWTFEVIESTKSFIVMEYSRPWESKDPLNPFIEFQITINGG